MRVTAPGILTADPERGIYFYGWKFEVPEGTVFASDEELTRVQLSTVLAFMAEAADVPLTERVDTQSQAVARMAIQRASSRDL